MNICPICGKINEDDWPLEVDCIIVGGGCQECWEKQCDEVYEEFLEFIKSQKHPLVSIMQCIKSASKI